MPRGISQYDEAELQGRLWTPFSLNAIGISWVDSSDLSTIRGNRWYARAPLNLYTLQFNSSLMPLLVNSDLNQKPVFSYGGVRLWSRADFKPGTQEETTIALVRTPGGAQAGIFTTAVTSGRDYYVTSSGEFVLRRRNVITYATSGAGNVIKTNQWTLVGLEYTATSAQFYQGGEPLGPLTSTSIAFSTTARSLIGSNGFAEPWGGEIAELLSVPFVSETSRQIYEGYLAWKWGVQHLLPAVHPFISRPPAIGD